MRQNNKNKSKSHRTIINNQVVLGLLSLVLLVSLLLCPNRVALAGDSTEEAPEQQYHFYLPMASSGGRAHYVSLLGDDANPGTFSHPWRTLHKAASMAEPGDTIYIRGGTYYESARFTTSGTASDPIKILAYSGENPIIDGQYTIPAPGGALLWIDGDYIIASGIEVRNSAYGGILVRGNYDVVDDMYSHHNYGYGILINQGHNAIVENSRVWRNSIKNEYGQANSWGQGLSAARDGVSYATIRHNVVWENWGEGVSTFEADHTVIEDNIIHDNFSTNIYISDATNILCQRNFVYSDPTSYVYGYGSNGGIMLGDETYNPPSANITVINNISSGNRGNFWWWRGSLGGGMNNVLIANNTFVNGIGIAHDGYGGVIIAQGDHQNVRFENNIVLQDGDLPVIATDARYGITYSNNLWSKTPPSSAAGPGDIIGDPLFAHAANPFQPEWYLLTGISPVIDRALSLSEVNVDYFGFGREAPPDMGANEFFPPP